MLWRCGHRDKEDLQTAVRQGEIKRILILRCQKMGDMLTFLPVITGVHNLFPEAVVTLVCRDEGLGVAGRIPFLDIIKLDDLQKELAERAPYDILITSSQDSGRVKFKKKYKMKYAIGVLPESFKGISFKHRLQYSFFTDEYRFKKDEHEVKRNMALLGLLGGDSINSNDRTLWITDEERDYASSLLNGLEGPIVVISPSGSKESKNWPAERFAELCDRLVRERGVNIVVAGKGPLAEKQASHMIDRMSEPSVSIIDKTGLGEFAAVLEKSDLLISIDSGTAHVASYLNRPLLVLFGPGDYEKWKPWHLDSLLGKALHVDCECGTTIDKCHAKEHCLNSIKTEDVLNEAVTLLDRCKDRL